MRNRKILLLLFFLCTSISSVFAQLQTGTPTATDQKANNFSDGGSKTHIYNTSLYTGTADINIPIYNYSLGNLDLGVSLSYNTKGILVDQIASSCGLGWTLNAGGYIERQVNGVEDECFVPSVGPNDQVLTPVTDRPRAGAMYGAWTEYPTDQELDKFTLVLPGRTVNFSVDFGVANWLPIVNTWPKSEMQITVLYNGDYSGSHYFVRSDTSCTGQAPNVHAIGFVVADEQGNTYRFQALDYQVKQYVDYDSAIHRVSCYSCSTSHLGPSSETVYYYPTVKWVLTEVTAYNGQSVTYHYDTSRISYLAYADDLVTERIKYTVPFGGTTYNAADTVNHSITVPYTATVSHLTSIDYPNGTSVTLNTATDRCDIMNAPIIKSISISQKYDDVIKNSFTYNLNYAYFNTPYVTDSITDTSTEVPYGNSSCFSLTNEHGGIFHLMDGVGIYTRLKLKSIDRIGTDNTSTDRYYTFNYNHTALPARLSPYQDWWGYYNYNVGSPMYPLPAGITNNYGTILSSAERYVRVPYHLGQFTDPSGNLYTSWYGVHKSPNFASAQADILTSIINGTGGETDLYYKDFANFSVKDTPTIGIIWPHGASTTTVGIDTDMLGANTCDGLVLDKIVTTDGYNHDNDVTEQYDYALGEQFCPGQYFWYPKTFTGSNYDTVFDYGWVNHPLNSVEMVSGSNHGFRSVTVTTSGVNGLVSKTNYTFSGLFKPSSVTLNSLTSAQNLSILGGLLWHTFPRQFIYPDFFGLPLTTTSYDPSGDILSQQVNTYDLHAHDGYFPGTLVGDDNLNKFWFTYSYIDGSGTLLGNKWPFSYANLEGDQGGAGMPGTSGSVMNVPVLIQSTSTTYSGGNSLSKTVNYTYDNGPGDYNYDNIKSETWTDSKGNTCRKSYWWNILAPTTMYNGPAMIQQIGGDSIIRNDQVAEVFHTVPYMDIAVTGQSEPNIKSSEVWASTIEDAPVFDTIKRYTKYDGYGNLTETRYCKANTYESALFDTRIGKKVADVKNAKFNDIAYTSFEGSYSATPSGSTDYLKGNWEFDPTEVFTYEAMTGHYAYFMSPLVPSNVIRNVYPLPVGKKYIVSFWADGNVPLVYTSASIPPTMPPTLTYFTPKQQYKVGNWKFYTTVITGYQDDIYIAPPSSGATLYLDELRLYPLDAEMNSWTYEPLLGVSSHNDERSDITYYEYDVQGHQKAVRDVNGNIISLTKTVTQGLDN